ncbi:MULTISPECIES: carbohydrate ABC transporter permease [unclassified Oceanispirochaeta]|uniref:carbohydrate ABC transporter permease n=1 Tax=unclassified Oceanispirochaeta TaxID=2635722 RepID=UPI001314EFD2|nr:sugar ABC transporter permease [Oceanispirochaeta sp. M1]MBF9014997.1 sugar ABC transporter permease [Oceanispirochaeta sp. M2]NPD71322.1 sugar ABC transporter permease [Oceanispirochaeta sp. M1]
MRSKEVLKKETSMNGSKTAFLFLLPLMLILGVFLIFSILFILKNGFYKLDLSFRSPVFVGLQNYRILISDSHFFLSILNNIIFASVVVLSGITLGFLLAVLLSLNIPFSKTIFALVFIPSILPRALIATVFRQMFEHHTGSVNGFISFLGLSTEKLMWLTSPPLAYLTVMGLFVYMIGIPLLYYNADLASIPQSILESARIDGAGLFTIMFKIIYPLVSSSHKTIIISSVLASFRMFEVIFLLTQSGPGFTTEISGTYIYRFTRQGSQIGYVCAASTVVLFIALLIAIVQTSLLYKNKKKP